MKVRAATVISASPRPIKAWTPSMANTTACRSLVPLSHSCSAVASAPAITDSQAATPATASFVERVRPDVAR